MIGLLASRFGQMAALLIVGGIAWTAWLLQHDRKVETKAFEKVAAASQASGERANAKNEIVRKRAAAPGALARLRADSSTCDDCNVQPMPRLDPPKDQARRRAY